MNVPAQDHTTGKRPRAGVYPGAPPQSPTACLLWKHGDVKADYQKCCFQENLGEDFGAVPKSRAFRGGQTCWGELVGTRIRVVAAAGSLLFPADHPRPPADPPRPLRTLDVPLRTLRGPLRTLCASVKRAGSAERAVACMGRTAGSREGNAGPQGLLADTLWRSLELLVVTSQTGAVCRWPVSRAC